MNFESHSQAGQDRFVWEVLNGKRDGRFLDIGANHPKERSNTFELAKAGWNGWLIERDPNCIEMLKAARGAKVIEADATTIDWGDMLKGAKRIDYLSLDVDEASVDALERVLLHGARFDIITAEHDEYRFGRHRMEAMTYMLREHGYNVLCPQVCDQGMSFEVWAVDGHVRVPARLIRSGPTDWKEFFV
jgi:hypothetical protein